MNHYSPIQRAMLRENDNRDNAEMVRYLESRIEALRAFPVTSAVLCSNCRHVFASGPARCPNCRIEAAFLGVESLISENWWIK